MEELHDPESLLFTDYYSIDSMYKKAIKFYREKEKDGSLNIDYVTKLRLIAISRQSKYGCFKDDIADYGWLNLVGNDVRKEWKKISNFTTEKAMVEFIRLLDVVCPTFRSEIREKEMATSAPLPVNTDQASEEKNTLNPLQSVATDSEETVRKFEHQRKLIKDALNNQTYHQFLAYAQQTHPGQPEKQKELIQQLQEQHYEQYISQVCTQQAQIQADSIGKSPVSPNLETNANPIIPSLANKSNELMVNSQTRCSRVQIVDEQQQQRDQDNDDSDMSRDEQEDETSSNPKISPATMWSSRDIQEFKNSIRKENSDGIIKVGHGETITVRVPTHSDGTFLYWEFATDYYDIGFGVYFEWIQSETNQIIVQVTESDEDYDDEIESSSAVDEQKDVESGLTEKKAVNPSKPRIDEIIPVFRRDCHLDVVAGNHAYPGQGVYLLKFDNTYSLWRSKTLYYRVFYSK